MADQPFLRYPFKVNAGDVSPDMTPLAVARTLPERLNDVVNVKDWGAKGDGVTDDTAAINAAIDHAITLGMIYAAGAIIFFPPGTYYIGSPPLVLDRNPATLRQPPAHYKLKYVGAGMDVSIIRGYYYTGEQIESYNNSFLLRCGRWETDAVVAIYDLTIQNDATGPASGCLNVEFSGNNFHLVRCHLHGFVGLSLCGNVFCSSVRDNLFTCSAPITAADNASRAPLFSFDKFLSPAVAGVPPARLNGSVGMYIGQGQIFNNQIIGFDVGIAHSQEDSNIVGNFISRCSLGIWTALYGGTPVIINEAWRQDPGGRSFSAGITLCSNRFDRCTWAIYNNGGHFYVGANTITGARSGASAIAGPYNPVPIQSGNISWNASSHLVTVTMTNPHNINLASNPVLQLAITTSGGSNPWTSDPYGFVTVTGGDAYSFTYAGPAIQPSNFVSGSWNYPVEYCYIMSRAGAAFIAANLLDAEAYYASIGFLTQPPPLNEPFSGAYNSAWAMRGIRGWAGSPPQDLNWDFRMCGTAGANNNPSQFMTFAQLPGQSGVTQTIPIEGSEYNIIDARAQPKFAGVVSGGGSSNHYKVRYDGANWIRVG